MQMTHMRVWLALPALLGLAAFATPARAQFAPMGGLNAMMQNQIYLNQLGNQMANRAGWQAYLMMQQYRARTGFTGAFPSFVTPEQQRESAAALSRAYDAFRASSAANSAARAAGAENFALHGVLGQQTMVNPSTGGIYYNVPNDYNHYYATPQGIWGTNSEMYAPWGSTQLMPVR